MKLHTFQRAGLGEKFASKSIADEAKRSDGQLQAIKETGGATIDPNSGQNQSDSANWTSLALLGYGVGFVRLAIFRFLRDDH
jgi:hypothetical protein